MKKKKDPYYTGRRCVNCEFYVPHKRPMNDGCTHPLEGLVQGLGGE